MGQNSLEVTDDSISDRTGPRDSRTGADEATVAVATPLEHSADSPANVPAHFVQKALAASGGGYRQPNAGNEQDIAPRKANDGIERAACGYGSVALRYLFGNNGQQTRDAGPREQQLGASHLCMCRMRSLSGLQRG